MSFNYGDFNPSDYGLTKTDEKSGEGVINDGKGNYYKIDNFERQQNEDLDTDELGKSAGLQALAQEHTDFNVTSFNTANDVQGALRHLAGSSSSDNRGQSWNEAVESGNLSQNVLDAIERTSNYKENLSNKLDDVSERYPSVPVYNMGSENNRIKLDTSAMDSASSFNDPVKTKLTDEIAGRVSSIMRDKV